MLNLKLPKQQKDDLIERMQDYFYKERSEELGALATEQLLLFMLEQLGPIVYNHAIEDARKLLGERMAAFEDELYALEKPLARTGRD